MIFTIFFIAIIFLCIGSFLNVLIYRLPRDMSIISPGSACTSCGKTLRWVHNIPLLSFLWLKKCCYFCHQKISWRYFIVELLTAVTGLILFWKSGLSINHYFIITSLFSLILIILIFIDIDYQLLPDIFTLSLLWLGLLVSTQNIFIDSHTAIIGAASGYLSLWGIAKIYEKVAHTEGMGHGDFKLLAALGAWTGWESLLNIVLAASVMGLAAGVYLMLRQKAHARTPLAFGPYLAISGWIMLIFPHIFPGLI